MRRPALPYWNSLPTPLRWAAAELRLQTDGAAGKPKLNRMELLMFLRRLSFHAGLCIVVLLIYGSSAASADPIPVPLGAFSGSESVVQFNVAVTQPLPYSEDGATFATYTGLAASVLSFNNFLFMAGSGTLPVTFSDPVTMAGLSLGSSSFGAVTVAAEVFADPLGLHSLGQVSLGSFAGGFVGLGNDVAFSRVNLSFAVPANASFFIDDFRFEATEPVPEPATITLALAGLGWLGHRVRHRRRSHA